MENNEPTSQPNNPQSPPNPANAEKVIQAPVSTDLTNPQSQPVAQATPNVSNIYPEVSPRNPETSYLGNSPLAGSQMQPEKKKMLVGVYIIAGFNLLGFIAGFFDSSQTSALFTIAMFINLLLAVGLILRVEAARKFMIGLSVLILVLTTASLILLVGLQGRMQQIRADYDVAISRVDQTRLTSAQKKQLEDMNATIAAQEKQAGSVIAFTYARLGMTAIASVVIIVYLTRPRVKSAFHGV